jgi:hypothetical protein
MPSDLSKPFVQYESDNHGSAVVLATLVSLVVMLPFVVTRIILAVVLKRDRGFEHGLSLLSVAVAIVQAFTIVEAVHHGLGKHQSTLSEFDIMQSSKVR